MYDKLVYVPIKLMESSTSGNCVNVNFTFVLNKFTYFTTIYKSSLYHSTTFV